MDNHPINQNTSKRNYTSKKAIGYLSIVLLSYSISASTLAETIEIDQVSNNIEITSSTTDSYTIELTLGNYEKEGVQINGEEYFKILLEDGTSIDEQGAPDLPRLTRRFLYHPTLV
jgi:hypothetical protein